MLDLLYRIKLNFLNHLLQINQFRLGIKGAWKKAAKYPVFSQYFADELLHPGSLTQRLQIHINSFQIMMYERAAIHTDHKQIEALTDYHKHNWQIREVILYTDAKPWHLLAAFYLSIFAVPRMFLGSLNDITKLA